MCLLAMVFFSILIMELNNFNCVCLPLCVCWLAAQEVSHPPWRAESSVPDPPPTRQTHRDHLIMYLNLLRMMMRQIGVFLSSPRHNADLTLTIGTYSSGAAGWILLDISITALTNPVTFSYTLSLERSKLAVGGGLISWGCSCTSENEWVTMKHLS